MAEFTNDQCDQLRHCLVEFNNWLSDSVDQPVRRVLGVRPRALTDVFADLKALMEKCQQRTTDGTVLLSTELSLAKRAIIHTRRVGAFRKEERERQTFNREVRELLDDQMRPIVESMKRVWFHEVDAYKSPKLSNFLTIDRAQDVLTSQGSMELKDREFDEKFQTLLSPRLFLPDLKYYRAMCGLRDLPVAVVYIDIDDFKCFNTAYTEMCCRNS